MGSYIEVSRNKQKAEQIIQGLALYQKNGKWDQAPQYDAEITTCPQSFQDIPEGKALICVVDNGIFEAAAFCYNEREFAEFTDPRDLRPKTWILMDLSAVQLCTGDW